MAKVAGKAAPRSVAVARTEVLDQVVPSDAVEQDAGIIREFLKGLAPFFTRAQALESAALNTLDAAKTLTLPQTMEEDVAIQTFVKTTSQDKAIVEEHWGIAQRVSRFHRSLTAARGRAVTALEQANSIGNRLHNAYTEAERQRAAREQENIRREAEAQAQRDRDAEVARQQAAAEKLEGESPILSERERDFVDLTIAGFDSFKAASRAGYAQPRSAAERLLKTQKIIDAIQALKTAKQIRDQAAATKALPLDVQVEEVKPQIARPAGGGFDRTTHSAQLLDEAALIKAILAGTPGIPTDLLTINQTRLNQWARDLKEKINLWPGVCYKKDTRVM